MARGSISTATPETFFAQTGGIGDTGGGDGSQQEPVGMLRPQVPGSTTADLAPHKEAVPNPVNDGGPWLDKAPMTGVDSGSGFISPTPTYDEAHAGDPNHRPGSVLMPTSDDITLSGPAIQKSAPVGTTKLGTGSASVNGMQTPESPYQSTQESFEAKSGRSFAAPTTVPSTNEGRAALGKLRTDSLQQFGDPAAQIRENANTGMYVPTNREAKALDHGYTNEDIRDRQMNIQKALDDTTKVEQPAQVKPSKRGGF